MSDIIMPLWLHQRAQLTPERIAYEFADTRITFYELDKRARRLAECFAAQGIAASSRVAILQENTLQMVYTLHALIYLGAVAVPLNCRLTAHELAFQLEDSAAASLIADSATFAKARETGCTCMILNVDNLSAPTAQHIQLRHALCLDDPCTIIYTSGTTGQPKGVVLTYGNHWWNANASLLNLGLQQKDAWLCCVPLFHVSGLSIFMKNIIYGMTVHLYRHFQPDEVLSCLRAGAISHISLVASMLQRLLDADPSNQPFPKTLRCVLLGGASVPPALLERCLKRGIPVYQTYGMTETASQCVTLPPEYMQAKAGSAGKPLFPLQLRIDSSDAVNEPGEILIQGPTVFSHYLNRGDATREAFTASWFHTGDIGYLDGDGFLFVLDRRKDLIISGGENIYPAEVEAVLRLNPNITGAAVIGVPDHEWGQVPIAFVTLRDPSHFLADELTAHCRRLLASYKVPKQVIVCATLPENAAHKVLRRKLYEQWMQQHS
ncbi:MAG: o-succinylbenzoate--CoA ligase [Sporolactobacillus sp.]